MKITPSTFSVELTNEKMGIITNALQNIVVADVVNNHPDDWKKRSEPQLEMIKPFSELLFGEDAFEKFVESIENEISKFKEKEEGKKSESVTPKSEMKISPSPEMGIPGAVEKK